MRTTNVLIGLLSLSVLLAACNKEMSTSSSAGAVSTQDVASAVGAGVATDGFGLVSQMQDGANVSQYGSSGHMEISAVSPGGIGHPTLMDASDRDSIACGFLRNESFKIADSNSVAAYSLSVLYHFQVSCVAGQRSVLNFTDSIAGRYNGPRVNSTVNATTNLTVNDLEKTDTAFMYMGEYDYAGATQSKINKQTTFSATVKLVLDSAAVNKKTHEVTGGSAVLTVTGSTSTGKTFTYTGNLKFLGNRKARILLGKDTYIFDLVTGNLD